MKIEEKYMQRALDLAEHGRGSTSPNPMVGAVIVAGNGRIIGEGYHRRCGQAHAEVNAIASVSEADRPLLADSTMYVTLEPCSHYGKTPPCAELIIRTGIPRVVVGATDPFVSVAGRGIAMLRQAGIEVATGIMAHDSRQLNARFITAHEQQRPWVTLKWAQSADGFIDSDRPDGRPHHFSNDTTALLTHRLRSLHDAILVGSGTAIADRPRLDCRLWPALHQPQPVILDRRGRLSPDDNTTSVKPLIFTENISLGEVLSTLYAKGITSVLVEGGAAVLQSFIDAGLWDAARTETTAQPLGRHGTARAPQLSARPVRSDVFGSNRIDIYSNNDLFRPDII